MHSPVKILASSEEELGILSACLQDALISLNNASFDIKNKKFFFLANRYQWEKSTSKKGLRTLTVVAFENIEKVETANINFKEKPAQNLSLLNIEQDKNHLLLNFAGGIKIRLHTNQLKIKLRDEGVPWPAKAPKHI